jgi:hypothetical protein
MKIAGPNDAHVGNVAGHSDPRTTKRYTHFSVEETKVPLQALAGKSFLSSKEAIGVQSLWIKK